MSGRDRRVPARVTAGDLLESASHDLRRARLAGDPPARLREVLDIMRRIGQITVVLDRYLADIDPFRAATPRLVRPGGGWPLAALQAREWLGETAQNLRYDGRLHLHPQPPLTTMARCLDSAAVSLSAARDLLHTHLTPDRRGGPYTSEWAPVILSPNFTRALSAEVASAAVQLAMAAMGARTHCPPGGYQLADARARLASAERRLAAAAAVIEAEHQRDPVHDADLDLLHAVPARLVSPRVMPGVGAGPAALLAGIVTTAERARQATWETRPAWSPEVSGLSLRHTAGASVVVSHNCRTALELLTSRARQLGLRRTAGELGTAAGEAAATRSRWLAVARSWSDHIVTDTSGPRSSVSAETADLALWTGRLVYADPQWTPLRGRRHALRSPVDLAVGEYGLAAAVAAVHHVAETVSRLADADLEQVRVLARAGRLYVRTRSLPAEVDIPRPYGRAPRDRVGDLARAYQEAAEAGARLAASMDLAAAAANAPSRVLSAARAAAGRAPVLVARSVPHAIPRGPVTGLLQELGVRDRGLLAQAAKLDLAVLAGAAGRGGPAAAERRADKGSEPEAIS